MIVVRMLLNSCVVVLTRSPSAASRRAWRSSASRSSSLRSVETDFSAIGLFQMYVVYAVRKIRLATQAEPGADSVFDLGKDLLAPQAMRAGAKALGKKYRLQ